MWLGSPAPLSATGPEVWPYLGNIYLYLGTTASFRNSTIRIATWDNCAWTFLLVSA